MHHEQGASRAPHAIKCLSPNYRMPNVPRFREHGTSKVWCEALRSAGVFTATRPVEVVGSPAKPQRLKLRTRLSVKADRDLFLPVNSTGGHFVLGKHIPPGPGHWADFTRFLHVMHKHRYKPLKFLQKTGGRSKHFIELALIVGLKGMPNGAAPREMLNICFVLFPS